MRLPSLMFWLVLIAGLGIGVGAVLAQADAQRPPSPPDPAMPRIPLDPPLIPPPPTPPGLPATPAAPDLSAPDQSLRDPTSPAPRLRDLMDPARNQPKSFDLPSIQLKGRIIGGLQPSAAILEIDRRPYLVRKGSEIVFPGARSGIQTIRILDLTAQEVRLELSPLGQSLSVN